MPVQAQERLRAKFLKDRPQVLKGQNAPLLRHSSCSPPLGTPKSLLKLNSLLCCLWYSFSFKTHGAYCYRLPVGPDGERFSSRRVSHHRRRCDHKCSCVEQITTLRSLLVHSYDPLKWKQVWHFLIHFVHSQTYALKIINTTSRHYSLHGDCEFFATLQRPLEAFWADKLEALWTFHRENKVDIRIKKPIPDRDFERYALSRTIPNLRGESCSVMLPLKHSAKDTYQRAFDEIMEKLGRMPSCDSYWAPSASCRGPDRQSREMMLTVHNVCSTASNKCTPGANHV